MNAKKAFFSIPKGKRVSPRRSLQMALRDLASVKLNLYYVCGDGYEACFATFSPEEAVGIARAEGITGTVRLKELSTLLQDCAGNDIVAYQITQAQGDGNDR